MGAGKYYYKDGFTLDTPLDNAGLIHKPMAAVSVIKGQALHNSSGYVTNATTAFDNGFEGIAAATIDNSAGDAGDYDMPIIPPNSQYSFWVKVEEDAKVTQADLGLTVDLQANNSVDINDTTLVAWGFKLDKMDVSDDAISFNAYGMVKGRFEKQPQ